MTGEKAELATTAEKDEYRRVTAGADNWLGTGRYAQGRNGERIDILERIFKGGGNETDGDETRPGMLKSQFVANREQAMAEAENKVEAENNSADGVFNTGSNIADDYPILLGTKNTEGGQPLANLPWEQVRAEGGVNLDNFTHIEVPKERIRETRALLEKYGVALPVVAIGVGTAVALERVKAAEETGAENGEYEDQLVEPSGEEIGEILAQNPEDEKVREVRQKLVAEAEDFYQQDEVTLLPLMEKYLGAYKEVIQGEKTEAKQSGSSATDYVEKLLTGIGKTELEMVTERIRSDVKTGEED